MRQGGRGADFRLPCSNSDDLEWRVHAGPADEKQKQVEARIDELAESASKKLGIDRRRFLASSGGMAASFLAMNEVFGRFFHVDLVEMFEPAAYAQTGTPRDMFVFDDQLHMVRGSQKAGGAGLRALAQGPSSAPAYKSNPYNPKGLPDEHGEVWGVWNPALAGLPITASKRLRLRPNEKVGGDGMVALWTSGAAGDQNPVSMGGKDFFLVDALGKMLGEQVVRVSGGIKALTTDARLWGAQQEVSCPGRRWTRGAHPPLSTDSDPVNIRLSLLMLNDVALAGVTGEVFTLIHQHLDKRSPFSHTIMLTHTNGSSGYIPDETAFEHMSYEITS